MAVCAPPRAQFPGQCIGQKRPKGFPVDERIGEEGNSVEKVARVEVTEGVGQQPTDGLLELVEAPLLGTVGGRPQHKLGTTAHKSGRANAKGTII